MDHLDPQYLLTLADRVVGWARPGEHLEVAVGGSREVETRAYGGEIESLTSATSTGVMVRVVVGGRQGTARAGTLEETVLAEVLAEARDNASFGTPDPWVVLAEPDGVAFPPLDLFDPAVDSLTVDERRAFALALDAAVLGGDPRIVGLDGSADFVDSVSASALVSTTGIRVAERESGCSLSVLALAEQDGDAQVGFGCTVARSPAGLDPAGCARQAVERSTRLLGASQPPTGRLTVVFEPWVTAQFLGIIGELLSGEEVRKGRSPFVDRLGSSVAAGGFTLVEDPTDPLAYGASLCDDEGLAARRTVLVEGGVLSSFLHNSLTCRALGAPPTASAARAGSGRPSVGARALRLEANSERGAADLLAGVDRGVLVQEVSGLHSGVNPTSGDLSVGIEGVRISGGSPGEPVREAIVASSLQRMLSSIAAVGADREWLPADAAGCTLVIDDVMIAGA